MADGIPQHAASELKQQGAFEAARDPNSSVTVEQAETKAVQEARSHGVPAFKFDPNASAEEKAKQVRANIPPELQHIRQHKTAGLASDQDDGTTAGYDLPSPSKDGALPAPTSPSQAEGDGQLGQEKAEDWERVRGPPRFATIGKDKDERTLLDHQDFLESKLDEKFFGDWYHNTAVIIFACLSSWTIATLGGGLGWIMIVMAFCGTYYRTSLRRVRRNFRDDVHREMSKQKLDDDTESLEWINNFMDRFWPIYSPILCATIVSSVDQVLSTSTPAFLDSMRMRTFTLGNKPPRLEHVKTYAKVESDLVVMDWKFSFTPNDTMDLTRRQIADKENPKIVLEIRVGKAMVSKALAIIVEDMAFSGTMQIRMKLQLPFPHVEKIDICFLDRPKIDYVCKPLGGETFGFDINFIPGLESFIMEQVHANLGPMMYKPNYFPIEIAKMLAGTPVDQAIGVLQVTFHGAQGLKNPDKFSGTPDPYATVSINGREVLGKTKTVHENANPRWSETVNIILTSFKDNLTITVSDYNEIRKDKELGQATFALERLEQEHFHENEQLEIFASGRPRGIVQADIRFFPVLEGDKLPDGTMEPPPESNSGIAKFTVESAKELDASKSSGQLNPYAVLLLNGKEVKVSKKLKHTNNPIWPDATKELLITDRKKAKLALVIKDDRDLTADPIVGQYQIRLTDMLELMDKGQEWYNLPNTTTGRVKMTLQWKPVALEGASGGSGGYVTPIGVMRIHLQKAVDVRNLETMGKSDPYARVMLSGIQKGRTVTFQNNLNPEWDEVIYVAVHTNREKLTVEVMDEENLGKDRSLGTVEIAASDYVREDITNGGYETSDTKQVITSPLFQGPKGPPKGTLHYTVSFFPTIPVVDPEEEEREAVRPSVDTHRPQTGVSSGRPSIDTKVSRVRSGTVGTISSLRSPSSTQSPTLNGDNDLKKKLAQGESEQTETAEMQQRKELPKIRLTADDLTNYESGLLVFKLLDGDLSQIGCHLEIVMDDNLFPAYSSAKTRSRQFTFNETGDAMIRELDVSKITIRLVESVDKKGEGEENFKAKLTGETISVLRQALYTPTQLTLKDKAGRESKITVSLKFLPVRMTLDPSESVNNQGNLRVEVLDAADLPAADRNGYSDPFCKFNLNGKEVFKSKVQKKTLHPAWNEYFEVPVRSRIAAKFDVHVFDWDIGNSDDFLGKAAINLEMLVPFQKQEVRLVLDGKSGVVRLSMLFKPDYVMRSRQGSSTFSGTFATPGKIVGAPVKGVEKGVGFVGGGVVKGASFLGRGFKSKKGRENSDGLNGGDSNGTSVPTIVAPPSGDTNGTPATTDSYANRDLPATPGTPGDRRKRQSVAGAEQGTATISVISASGFPAGAKVQVAILQDVEGKKKEVLRTKPLKAKTSEVSWEEEKHVETKKVTTSAAGAFRLAVFDHATFGNSDELGDATFYVDDQGTGGADRVISVGSAGASVTIRSSFEPSPLMSVEKGGAAGSDAASLLSTSKDSPAGKARRSFMGRSRERSATPGT